MLTKPKVSANEDSKLRGPKVAWFYGLVYNIE